MALRALLVILIVAATAAFVVGVGVEHGEQSAHHDQSGEVAAGAGREAAPGETRSKAEERGEASPAEGQADGGSESAPAEPAELRPLGVDVEAWPVVIIAALASLALAVAAFLRPRLVALLALVSAAMLAFAALDVLEAVRKADVDDTGLAILAGIVAALHLGAAVLAAVMASQARRPRVVPPGPADTMPT